jgi:hypothetical protein
LSSGGRVYEARSPARIGENAKHPNRFERVPSLRLARLSTNEPDEGGRRHDAAAIIRELDRARIYVGLGDKERVFEWLRKGYEDRSDHLLNLGVDPAFDGVRRDPRFIDLLGRVGLPQ